MGGRGASRALGGGVSVTMNAGGTATITPNPQNPNAQTFTGGGPGVSDTNSHTTYFTPADKAIVSNDVTNGFATAQRSGLTVPVGYYQTGYYSNVNSELRDLGNGYRQSLSPKTQVVVDAMDRNMRPLNNAMDSTRWTSVEAIADNIGIKGYATTQSVINKLANNDVSAVKHDYTSSSWKASANTVAGKAGRNVRVDMHYSKGAMVQFSPTRKEGEVVGARGVRQRYSNARIERVYMQNAALGNRYADVLVVDCYVD